MDRVRFGRVLGFGARQAAKTLVAAVDAAAAENPSARQSAAAGRAPAQPQSMVHPPANSPVRTTTPARQTATPLLSSDAAWTAARKAVGAVTQAHEVQRGLGRSGRKFGQAVWNPFVRLSGVVMLEVSGVFFGIFALLALGYLCRLRGAWHATAANAAEHRSLMGAAVMLALFGYFCVSSFVRARRRERGR